MVPLSGVYETLITVALAAGCVVLGWSLRGRDQKRIIMTQAELSAALDKLTAQVGKVAAEQSTRFDTLTAEVKRLTDIINAGEVTPEVAAALATVQTALQNLDDAIPDAP